MSFSPSVPAIRWLTRTLVRRHETTSFEVGLAAGEVHRIDGRRGSPVTLRVARGTVWLTTTSATDDVILRAGDTCVVACDWPLVMEAIGDSAHVHVTRMAGGRWTKARSAK